MCTGSIVEWMPLMMSTSSRGRRRARRPSAAAGSAAQEMAQASEHPLTDSTSDSGQPQLVEEVTQRVLQALAEVNQKGKKRSQGRQGANSKKKRQRTPSTSENIALKKPAYQQYPYTGPGPANHLVEASNAVDGFKTNLSVWGGQCVLSDNDKQTATWWVNLTSILSIHHVTIYYRTEVYGWGPHSSFPSRFLGFSVYVSNTTDILQGTLCYKDTNFTLESVSPMFNATCPLHGQYVIFYNERLTGVTYPDGYSAFAYNELCEVEVYGCLTPGQNGPDCSTTCPDSNCRYCHNETGSCLRCKPGYHGHRCELACEPGTYGYECGEKCGQCEDQSKCFHTNGLCLTGCRNGYHGDLCKTLESPKALCDVSNSWQSSFYGVLMVLVLAVIWIGFLMVYIVILRKLKRRTSNNNIQMENSNSYITHIETDDHVIVSESYMELRNFRNDQDNYESIDFI
uniref:Uncharacterized protein LOC111114650 isoform X3 n=1 Tax=Crassostrea virginica TaxID=6565 RepID=A0A8B8BZE7_CRAVI|nr:uncharacterized protein LOC111114650 isoform X3 [Crassostrea virginica]